MRRAALALALCGAAAAAAGCDAVTGTYVLLRFEQSAPLAGLDHIEVQATLGGRTATTRFVVPAGRVLPFRGVLEIVQGDGVMELSASARDAADVEIGAATATVTVTRESTAEATLRFEAGAGARLTFDKTSYDFGTLQVGMTGPQASFQITNSGSRASAAISLTLAGAGAAAFSVQPGSCGDQTLAAGASCSFSAQFQPGSAGPVSAMIAVAAGSGSPTQITLSGTGAAPGDLQLTPTTHDFGSVIQNMPGSSRSFEVRNNGSAASGALAVALSGTDAAQFGLVAPDGCSGTTLAAGATCTLTVRFNPSAAGVRTASLTVTGSPGGVAVAALSGTSVAPGSLQISPSTQDFGASIAGQAGATHRFTITNIGAGASGALAVRLTGVGAGEFMLPAGGTCAGAALPASQTCTVDVEFRPTSVGAKQATLEITADPGGTVVATLTGTGQAAAQLGASPAIQDFGMVVEGDSANATVMITNSGDVASATLTSMLGGTDQTLFSLTSDGCAGSALAARATCSIGVRFSPGSPGAKSATLTVGAAGGPSTTAMLRGTGLMRGTLSITPTVLDLGPLTVGTPATSTLTVRNTGAGPTGVLAHAVSGGSAAEVQFTTPDTCTGSSLAAGASCTISFRLSPTVAGSKSASVVVSATPGGAASTSVSAVASARLVVTRGGNGLGTVTSTPGGVSCGATCMFDFAAPSVTLTAATDISSTFGGFTGCDSQPAPDQCTVAMTGARNVTASFTVKRFTLTLSRTGDGSGRITSNPAGVDCTAACTVMLDYGTALVLTAAPDASSDFTGWTGPGCTGTGTCSVTVTSDVTLSTAFFIKTVTLSINRISKGTVTSTGAINCGSTCMESMRYGTAVSLTATTVTGCTFTGWSGGTCSGTGMCQFNIMSTQTVTASFNCPDYSIQIFTSNAIGPGRVTSSPTGIDCDQNGAGTCSKTFPHGTSVTLTVTPANGHYFYRWTGTPFGLTGDCESGPLRSCPVYTDHHISLAPAWAPLDRNLVFATSQPMLANLGGALAYDTRCNQAATAAGINNVNNDGYVALMSDASSNAFTRLGAAEGFHRMDAKPIAATQAGLRAGTIYFPIWFDELGNRVDVGTYTGTWPDGSTSPQTCSNWTSRSSSEFVTIGVPFAGPGHWTGTLQSCDLDYFRVFCFGNKFSNGATLFARPGRVFYVSNTSWAPSGGPAAADARCLAEAPPGITNVKALLATTSPARSYGSLFSPTATYVRPDGAQIGTGAQILQYLMHTGPWQQGNGTYVDAITWLGASEINVVPTDPLLTCGDWTSSASSRSAQIGTSSYVGRYAFQGGTLACNIPQRLYCVEQ